MLFIIIFLTFLAVLFLWLLSLVISVTFGGAPTVYTNRRVIRKALKLADAQEGELMADLGCGNARSLIIGAKEFGLKGIGIEISPFYYFLARLNVFARGENQNIKIYFGNFRKYKRLINKSDLIYFYLFPKLVSRSEKWLLENMKSGSRAVALAFPLSTRKPANKVKSPPLFLYERN